MPLSSQDAVFAEALDRLRLAAHEDRRFEAAQIQLINLREIIANAGPHWPRVKDKIRTGSMNFLIGCLADDDIVLPAGDGFLIIFARGEAEALRARAQELRLLLLEFYLGEEELLRLRIEVSHRQISAAELTQLAAPPPQPPAPAADPITDSCLFAPICSVRPHVIASYLCTPVHRAEGEVRYGHDKGFRETGINAHRDYCELDLGLLDVAERALGRYDADGPRPAIGAPVHSTTFQHRAARAAYLERLAKIPPALLKHMFVQIAEIEAGTPLINLADWAGLLRARVRLIMLEFHHGEARAPNLTHVGVWGAGYRIAEPEVARASTLIAEVRRMRRWGESLGRQRLRYFVHGLSQPGLVRLAGQAGASFVSGDLFWPYAKWPGGVVSAPQAANSLFPARRKALSSAPN